MDHEDLAFQATEWEASPEPLHDFLRQVGVGGGCGREAVELGLYHAAQEHARQPVSQVIIIGDAPAQSRAHANQNRAQSPLTFSRFPNPTCVFAVVVVVVVAAAAAEVVAVCAAATAAVAVGCWLLLPCSFIPFIPCLHAGQYCSADSCKG